MPPSDSSPNGAGPPGDLAHSGPGGAVARQVAPDRGRDAAIEGLTLAVGRLRSGAAALKAENHELRVEIAGLQPATASPGGGVAPIHQFGKLAEVPLPTGSAAPGAARVVIAHCLTGLVSQRILSDVALLVSELVTNSLVHGELQDGDTVVVRVYLAADTLRVEVENPGTGGVIASGPRDGRSRRGGFGFHLVDRLATRWGVTRAGRTNAWFEMGRA
jgi:anti-sigma regulatory factor (Ser/Thr protein kinase)